MNAMLKPLFISLLALGAGAPAAFAQCDISQTKCALNGGKCNIQFRNQTAAAGGSDGGTSLDQSSSAQSILIKAEDMYGKRIGNRLKIPAGAKKTMNLDKKVKKNEEFDSITIRSQDNHGIVISTNMFCDEIKAVLNGNGTCKVFHGARIGLNKVEFALGYQCDGGNVSGP